MSHRVCRWGLSHHVCRWGLCVRRSLEGTAETRNYLVLSCLDNVVTEHRFWRYADGAFTLERQFKGEVSWP